MYEEKSVIKIFYDNDRGGKLVPELSTLVLYITGLSGHVKNRRDFPPVLLELYGLLRPFQVGPVDKLTFSVFISSYFLKCYKKAGKFGYLNRFYQPF